MGAAASLYVDVRANVSSATAALKKTESQFMATGAAAKKMDAAVATSGAGVARTSGKVTQASKGLKGSLAGMGMGASAAQGGVLALGYGLGKAVQTTVNFDRAMRNVNSIAGLSEAQFKGVSQSVRDMAGRTAQTPQKLAEGLYDLVSSGFNASQSLKILEASANAATAGLTTTEVSTSAVAAVLNAYQMPATKAASVSDILFKTVDQGVISFDQLASNIGDVLPFASSLGVSLTQVGASISTMTKSGINPAETMTRIKAVMTALISPSDQLKTTFRTLGYDSGSAMLKARGFQGTLEALARSTGGSKEKLSQLFPNVRALGGVLALTGGKAKAAQADLAAMNQSLGATSRALSEQKKSAQFRFDKAKAEAQALATVVGGALLPALENAADTANQLTLGANKAAAAVDKIGGKGTSSKIFSTLTASWPKIFGRMRDDLSKVGSMASQAWNGKPAKVEVKVAPKIEKASIASVTRQIQASAKSGKLSLQVSTNAKQVSPQLKAVSDAARKISAQKAKTDVTTPGADAARSRMAQLYSDIVKIPNNKSVSIRVNYSTNGKPKGLASGGAVTTALTEVNERGPESVRLPGGQIAMLGNGRRQVTALPNGSYVYTAAQTARMFGDIPHLAKGGKPPKRKKGESRADFRSRYNAWINRLSGIKDSGTDRKIASAPLISDGNGGLTANQIAGDKFNLARANRHLSEAKRMKGPERREAIARARAEIAQAKQQLALDQAQASQAEKDKEIAALEANTAAIQAQADALKANADEMAETRKLAESLHTATKGVTDTLIQGILDKTVGGQFSTWMLTSGARTAT